MKHPEVAPGKQHPPISRPLRRRSQAGQVRGADATHCVNQQESECHTGKKLHQEQDVQDADEVDHAESQSTHCHHQQSRIPVGSFDSRVHPHRRNGLEQHRGYSDYRVEELQRFVQRITVGTHQCEQHQSAVDTEHYLGASPGGVAPSQLSSGLEGEQRAKSESEAVRDCRLDVNSVIAKAPLVPLEDKTWMQRDTDCRENGERDLTPGCVLRGTSAHGPSVIWSPRDS